MRESQRFPAMGTRRRLPAALRRWALAVAIATGGAAPAGALELDPQLQEIRTLLREKRYPLALESLRLIARQIQELRLEAVAPVFPAPPPGWEDEPALSLLEEDEIWSRRIHAQRTYTAPGPARVEIVVDVNSPFAPAAALSFNPLAVAGDPQARIAELGGEKALVRYNPDAGEGSVSVLLGRDILVRTTGRGIASAEMLVDLARRVDYPYLRALSSP